MISMATACLCTQTDIFTIKNPDQECSCAPSETKLGKIFGKMLGSISPGKMSCQEQGINIQKRFEQEYIIPKKVVLDTPIPDVDLYLMIGSNKRVDVNAEEIKSFDLVDRSDGELNVFTDLEMELQGSVFVSIMDILHHIDYPERLVDTIIDRLSEKASVHYILISDHDCRSWEDAYYLDEIHYSISKNPAQRPYLPTYGYRKRGYWRAYMERKGYRIVFEKVPDAEYADYIDIYMLRS